MSTLIAARRMAPCACVAVAVAAHEHASANAEIARPVTMTIDAPSVGDAFDLQYGHIAPLLRTRVHLDDIFPNPIHNAFPKP